jgi:hypothetical protein
MKEETRILEELFDKGFATREVPVLGNKLLATVRSLSAADQLDIESQMNKDKMKNNAAAFIIHSYSLLLLSKTLVSYGETIFDSHKTAYDFLSKMTSSVVDKLVKAQNALEKDIRKYLELESVEANFSETGPLPEKSEQLPG